MANPILGLAGAILAAFMFAVQYTPVKSYEVHDGITFQWFLSSGSLFATILITAASGDLSMNCRGDGWMPFIGGMMFGLSNYFGTLLIKLLGMGKGFSLCNFINIMTGYVLGRIGFLGIPASGNHVGDIGCGIIGVSFILLANVNEEAGSAADVGIDSLEASLAPDSSAQFHEAYRQWSNEPDLGRAERLVSWDQNTAELLETIDAFNPIPRPKRQISPYFRQVSSSGLLVPPPVSMPTVSSGSSLPSLVSGSLIPNSLAPIEASPVLSKETNGKQPLPDSAAPPADRDCVTTVTGIALAVVTGMLSGGCAVPGVKYNLDHPGSPFASVFAMIVGFWFMATVIYVVYTTGARFRGIRVPHAPIRPSLIAGALWATGNALNIFNPTQIAFTISYAVAIVGCLIIAGLISLLFYREINGRKNIILFCAALLMQLIGVTMICCAN